MIDTSKLTDMEVLDLAGGGVAHYVEKLFARLYWCSSIGDLEDFAQKILDDMERVRKCQKGMEVE